MDTVINSFVEKSKDILQDNQQSICRPFIYPTPFELHFSVAHLYWYGKDPDDYISKMKGEDKDLAAHFTIITHRGKCLYGAPIYEKRPCSFKERGRRMGAQQSSGNISYPDKSCPE